ncbi:hypothetical protein F5Y06DRAFT_300614 [Hypoxylon sp. FL0890]|nr:hypothetical protein F5Y06DRAFT_300614 [Hypoxylon sp. FL0890]
MEASEPPWDLRKGNLATVRELPSVERPSELPNTVDRRASTTSQFTGNTSELDSRHVAYSTMGSPPPSDHPLKQNQALNPIPELEGSNYACDEDERQFYEVDARTSVADTRSHE